jgi:succinate dehydrogenase hydrophobic anchor subunit
VPKEREEISKWDNIAHGAGIKYLFMRVTTLLLFLLSVFPLSMSSTSLRVYYFHKALRHPLNNVLSIAKEKSGSN